MKKIYTIYENKLHALGVRETPKKFIEMNPHSAGRPFGFKQHLRNRRDRKGCEERKKGHQDKQGAYEKIGVKLD